MRKILLMTMLFFVLVVTPGHSRALVRFPNQAQIEKLCVPMVLDIDNEVHWIYYRHIKEFGDRGVSIVYGKRLASVDHYSKDSILNYNEALKRYKEIKRAND